jgi:DNA-binding NtrC family response regulator
VPDILVIEDEPMLAQSVSESLKLAGHEVRTVGTGEAGLTAIDTRSPDLILLDLRLPGIDGVDVLRELRQRGCTASVIVTTAYGNVESAVEAMKMGVSDYLIKPLDLQEMDLVVERVLRQRRVQENLEYFRQRERAGSAIEEIIGNSPPMQAVKRFIQRIVDSPALTSKAPPSILLTGETGTGKDLVARAIHYAGPRRESPFVHVNCTALPDHLVEAELFGHVKGAFTDARSDKRGLFEVADGGTIFLDEIGHMKAPLQSKLLGTLEHRKIRPVGATAERSVNVHFIAATNRNLREAIDGGDFREDLYHRLRVLALEMPPLHQRGPDIDALADHFLRACSGRFALPIEGFAPDAREVLRQYDWPGNVRELSHVIESAVLIADGPLVRPEHLNIHLPQPGAKLSLDLPGVRTLTLDFASGGPRLEDIEFEIIKSAVEYAKHNVSRAARILGISRDAVRYRLEKYAKEHGGDVRT